MANSKRDYGSCIRRASQNSNDNEDENENEICILEAGITFAQSGRQIYHGRMCHSGDTTLRRLVSDATVSQG
jgi:hypothetical protein